VIGAGWQTARGAAPSSRRAWYQLSNMRHIQPSLRATSGSEAIQKLDHHAPSGARDDGEGAVHVCIGPDPRVEGDHRGSLRPQLPGYGDQRDQPEAGRGPSAPGGGWTTPARTLSRMPAEPVLGRPSADPREQVREAGGSAARPCGRRSAAAATRALGRAVALAPLGLARIPAPAPRSASLGTTAAMIQSAERSGHNSVSASRRGARARAGGS
jgi:hypothetical protein